MQNHFRQNQQQVQNQIQKQFNHQKVDKELTSYSYDKEDDIQYSIALDEINEKANKKINIDKSTVTNIIDTLHDIIKKYSSKNNIRFTLEFFKEFN